MTLSVEQQQALDALFALAPAEVREQPAAPSVAAENAPADLLYTWTGIPSGTVKAAIAALLGRKDALEAQFIKWADANPMDAAFEFLGATAWAFYQAEKDANPKIKTYVDAFYYIATCASVGYADIFAVTQTGKAIAGLVMIVGPAITNKALDQPK